MTNIAQLSVDSLVKALSSMSEFRRKTWTLIGEDDLFHKGAMLNFPCAGVVYEGLRALPSTEKMGKASEVTCSIYVLYKSGTIGNIDYKPKALFLLDAIRDVILGTTAPGGHPWQFKFESPAEEMHKALVYYQRWSSVVIL